MSDPPMPDPRMPDPDPTVVPPESTPVAITRRARPFQLIWLIPIVAALVAGFLAYRAVSQRGPSITLTFRSADGLKAGTTKIRHKAVDLGTVDSIRLADDLSKVVVRVLMQHEATDELTDKARFWVVRPRLNAGNVSGLDTLLSGAYIELDPGTPTNTPAPARRDFTGLEEPPAIRSDEPGQSYVLQTTRIGGITSGSPVLYRDVTVGEVLRWDMSPDGQGFTVTIFVRNPFNRFVRVGTHFWDASGIGLDLGAAGVQLRLESLQALLSGGIAFDTSPEERNTLLSESGAEFRLYRDQSTARAAGYQRRIPYVTRFEGSVRGLAVGAPVEVFGIQIGSVSDIHLNFNSDSGEAHVDVKFEVQPERILSEDRIDQKSPLETTQALVQRGVRMQLHTANYLTGQLFLGMDYVKGVAPAEAVIMPDGALFFPGNSGGLDNLVSSVTDLTQKLSNIPFDQIGADLQKTMRNVSDLTGGPELKQTLQSATSTLAATQDLVRKLDAGTTPLLRRLPDIAASLQQTIDRTSKLVTSADTSYFGNSQVKRDVERLLVQLSDTARSVRLLADFLTQHPESLIQGKTGRASER
jgi:paraquat-inducible protein B